MFLEVASAQPDVDEVRLPVVELYADPVVVVLRLPARAPVVDVLLSGAVPAIGACAVRRPAIRPFIDRRGGRATLHGQLPRGDGVGLYHASARALQLELHWHGAPGLEDARVESDLVRGVVDRL